MQMMFHYWKTKGIRPSVFYAMDKGEKTIIKAFFEQEMDDKHKKWERAKEDPIWGTLMYILEQ